MLGGRIDYVQLKEDIGLVTGHVGPAQRILVLEKIEIERILDGWPPFYRQSFKSSEGDFTLESPLISRDQVRRPGWIVAIGLGRVQPTDLYLAQKGEEPLFRFAISRVRKMLEDQFKVEWPDHKVIASTIRKIDNIVKYGTSIEKDQMTWVASGMDTVSYPTSKAGPYLSKEECQTLIRVFHDMVISASDKDTLDSKLDIFMDRLLTGVTVALKYSSTGRRMEVPPVLQGDKIIYLRDCKVEDD